MMAPPSLTYDQVLKVRKQLYDSAVATGKVTPLVWPWDTFIMVWLFVAMYFSPYLARGPAKALNLLCCCLIVAQSLFIFTQRRSLGAASGYGWGLAMAWGWVMSFVFVLLHDVGRDYMRLEWRERKVGQVSSIDKSANSAGIEQASGSNDLRKRKDKSVNKKTRSNSQQAGVSESQAASRYHLVWQGIPDTAYHRTEWVIDLMTSFRGPNWNYRIPTLPKLEVQPPPKNDSVELSRSIQTNTAISTTAESPSSRSFRYKSVAKTFSAYLLIDIVKCVMITDPYFLGLLPLDSPTSWKILPILSTYSGIPVGFLVRLSRLLISLTGIISALFLIFSYSPLVFYTILPQFLNLRKIAYTPLEEKQIYPGFLQPPFPLIADKGLAGFWGQVWHQMFRYGISEPSKLILKAFNIKPRTQLGRAIQLFIAFGLTGWLHFAGSYTCFSIVPTKPLNPFLFFVLQAVGITLQTFLSEIIIKRTLKIKLKPKTLLPRLTNTLFVLTWLYLTGPLLADDFSRGGIWLFEPVPISFVRGIRGQGWFVWTGTLLWWWDGTSIPGRGAVWNKGIAVF